MKPRTESCCEDNRRESCKSCGKRLKDLENEVKKLNDLLQNFRAIVTTYYNAEEETLAVPGVACGSGKSKDVKTGE